jgi:ribosomal-protein-alanine N-acetyltransferase
VTYAPIAEGPRLYLREVRVSDVTDDYYRWMNDPEVTQFTESRFQAWSREALEAYVAAIGRDPASRFFAIVLKRDDVHVGNIKLAPINWIHRYGDIGLIIGDKRAWGQGYATEAITAVTEFAFRQLNLLKVTASCYGNNVGSVKAFKKAGFEEEGVRKAHFHFDGSYVDMVCLGRRRLEGMPRQGGSTAR